MKFNWKALVALVILLAVVFWGVSSLIVKSYSGPNLNFGLGSGPVTVTNPSDQPLSVQLLSPRSSGFTVTSPTEGLAGRSERQGTGAKSTQLYNFQLPAGTSEFTVRGTDINFVATTDTILSAIVQPVSSNEMRTILIAMAVVVVGALFYISQTMNHAWINVLRGRPAAEVPMAVPVPDINGGQGASMRTYGDNRAKSSNNP